MLMVEGLSYVGNRSYELYVGRLVHRVKRGFSSCKGLLDLGELAWNVKLKAYLLIKNHLNININSLKNCFMRIVEGRAPCF